MNQYFWIGLIVLASILLLLIVYYIGLSLSFSKGLYGKNRVGGILRRYAVSRNFKVLDNVTMSDGNKKLTIDHVLVGFFGLLFVTVLQGKGDFYGDLKEENWAFSDKGTKVSFRNPVIAGQAKVEMFRRIMSAKKIYSLPIESIVVVVGYGKESPLYLSNLSEDTLVVTVPSFKKYINLVKFEKDTNLDLDHLVAEIKSLH